MDPVEFANPNKSPRETAELQFAADGEDSASQPIWADLLAMPGVEGAGIGQNDQGGSEIVVYLNNESAKASLPASLHGMPVRGQVTGPINAQASLTDIT